MPSRLGVVDKSQCNYFFSQILQKKNIQHRHGKTNFLSIERAGNYMNLIKVNITVTSQHKTMNN